MAKKLTLSPKPDNYDKKEIKGPYTLSPQQKRMQDETQVTSFTYSDTNVVNNDRKHNQGSVKIGTTQYGDTIATINNNGKHYYYNYNPDNKGSEYSVSYRNYNDGSTYHVEGVPQNQINPNILSDINETLKKYINW